MINEDYYIEKAGSRLALTKVSSSASAFQLYFKVVDASTKSYSFDLKGFQNSASNPTANAANSILAEILTVKEQLMTKNTQTVMISPTMELESTEISDMQISQDNFIDGQVTTVTYGFKLAKAITDSQNNDFSLQLPQYRFYHQNFNQKTLLECTVWDVTNEKYISLDKDYCSADYDTSHQYLTKMHFKNICNFRI